MTTFRYNENNPVCSQGVVHDRLFCRTATAGAYTDHRHGQRTLLSVFLSLERIDSVCLPNQRGRAVRLRSGRTAIFGPAESVNRPIAPAFVRPINGRGPRPAIRGLSNRRTRGYKARPEKVDWKTLPRHHDHRSMRNPPGKPLAA